MRKMVNALHAIVALTSGLVCQAAQARADDLASLPSIESIGTGTDIRAFLAPGVPAEVTLAALRRAWSVDPAIRDFVGLAESSGDFDARGGMPGFGSIASEVVDAKLVTGSSGE
jgi:hypothetical protein